MLFSMETGFSQKPGACTNIAMCINFKSQENFEMYHSWISQASYLWKNKEKDIWETVNIFIEHKDLLWSTFLAMEVII